MAVDLRRSNRASCRQWLEQTLLALEGRGLLEAIYERNPPHYHVAVFPTPYVRYVAGLTGQPVNLDHYREASLRVEWVTHQVQRGETLSTIARQYAVSVSRIRTENRIRGDQIVVGQALRIPQSGEVVSRTVMQVSGNEVSGGGSTDSIRHTVRSGESLWGIAQRHGTTVEALARANGLRGVTIRPGQVLDVPVGP
jgi:LysM repeat protein